MAQLPDTTPTTSYSDPIYDRLEGFSQQLSRRWWLYVAVLILVIIAAGAFHRLVIQSAPEAAAAALYLKAQGERVPAKRTAEFRGLLDNSAVTPYFKARAAVEVVQQLLEDGKIDEARVMAQQAVDFAHADGQDAIQLVAQLTQAAVQEQAGDAATAETSYAQAERLAGAKFPDYQLTAVLGYVRTLVAQNRLAEAIDKLEPLTSRSDVGAESLLVIARVQYWQLKRDMATATSASAAVITATPAAVASTVADSTTK